MADILTPAERLLFTQSVDDLLDTFAQFNEYGVNILIRNINTDTRDFLGKGTVTWIDTSIRAVVRNAWEVSRATEEKDSVQFLDVGLLKKSDYLVKINPNTNLLKDSIIQINGAETVDANRILCQIEGLSHEVNKTFIYCSLLK